MNTEWSLKEIYTGIDDPAYEEDIRKTEQKLMELSDFIKNAEGRSWLEKAEGLLGLLEETLDTLFKVMIYVELRQSVDTEDGDMMAQQNRLMRIYAKMSPLEAATQKILAEIPDVDALAAESEIVRENAFYLKQVKMDAKHLLSDDVEEMISSMNVSGGAAWSQLQAYLTSTVKVDYDGGQMTLSEIRNLAYSPDAAVRKAAYEAELAAYEKIQDSVAFSLNHIKNQVTMLCGKRGYESPLSMTLEESRMKRETLDAMMEAIEEYLPVFRKYLRKKGEMLGHANGLPWYDLFAPLGKADKTYTIEEAKDYLIDTFRKFTPDMAEMMQEAFEQEWIDFYPRKGKQGGAFCAGVPCLKQSRILTNYDGYFGSIGTLAHELGHAFHNRQIENNRPLNQDYPMPVAETASTFNEVHLGQAALKDATGEERLNLLENDLREQTQCIVDIYSRYLFETAVFEQSQQKFLMADDLKALMLDAQKKAYGDGLDETCMHPYMWACKSHYYSEGLSFYNFPYAFGNLFAMGLYSLFLKEGDAFVEKYKAMLAATPCCTIEEAGAMMGIDLTKKAFWEESLSQIAKTVEAFCEM
ncbi:MAG: M3 family oligoendopeptidase [Clostridiales bacterium]|nr:M3 family oligoendopeptidase [Roseburia sp.]MDD7635772.1 M3 family oligoendopeptidase [Clostridiales bacterium]MDY4112299.1 M3 family oligoendopeptidase [Roseburia sp.]